MSVFYVYILRSRKDHRRYIGLSRDLVRRLREHNSGRTRSTKSRAPFDLIHSEECATLQDARKKERFYKTPAGRKELEKLGL